MNVRYTARAHDDLADITAYLDQRSPKAAHSVRRAIETSVALLGDFPELAQATDVPGVRELTIVRYPYKVYYAVDGGDVWILHIRDARRKPWTEEVQS
jgi:toxin ParE1/3/4